MHSLTKIQKTLEDNWDILAASKDPTMEPAMRLLHERMENPRSYVTMVGETSSGKSTLINSFLGKRFLVAGAKPTTGTVTWLEYGASDDEQLFAIDRNAQVAEISKEEFDRLTLQPTPQLLRLRALLPGNRLEFQGLTIFDTPGFNSIVMEHEEILKEFLPESDVIVFPVSYRVGFGQMDQELMTLVSELPTDCGETPVLLVVNRVPANVQVGNDARIQEIVSHAEDSLHRKMHSVLVVRAAMPDENRKSTLPETSELWEQVRELAFSQERQDAFVKKCREIVLTYCSQRFNELQGLVLAAENPQAMATLLDFKKELVIDQKASLEIVAKYTKRLQQQVPKVLDHALVELRKEANREIDNASKWVDIQDCSNYISGHKIPFGIRKIVRQVSDYIAQEIEQMDKELSEMANKAVMKMTAQVRMEERPELKELFQNLALRLGQQLAGKTANAMLHSLGGVGGVAAGAGNLVKMGVKQLGRLFHHTFSKEVYRQIGKIFTKKLMNALVIGLDAIVEIFSYIRESNRWQGELKKRVGEILDDWKNEALKELRDTSIPQLQENNRNTVVQCYEAMKQECQLSIDAQKSSIKPMEIASMKKDMATLQTVVKLLDE